MAILWHEIQKKTKNKNGTQKGWEPLKVSDMNTLVDSL